MKMREIRTQRFYLEFIQLNEKINAQGNLQPLQADDLVELCPTQCYLA